MNSLITLRRLSGVRLLGSRRYSLVTGMEQFATRAAVENLVIDSDVDKESVNTATIAVGDPSNAKSWEWNAGLDHTPKYSIEELTKMSNMSDPFCLVEDDINSLSDGMKNLLGSDHPVLESCAQYLFQIEGGGKKIRPTMVLAMSYALNGQMTEDRAVQIPGALPEAIVEKGMFASILQKRLAEITEMIHTASLFHDDVIDKASTRRGSPSVNHMFGNKLAILGGDFLLSRASVSLARLRNYAVVELMSTVVEHLVKGEIMQMKPKGDTVGSSALEHYLRKNFYKTASLMGHSCLSAAVLGNHSEECRKAAYLYGTYMGQAFQLVDDALDFEESAAVTGKVPLADLQSGLATAPTLFAAEEHPKMATLISRKFEIPGDVDEALALVKQSQGLQRCKDLAQVHAEKAIEAIHALGPSPARDALIALACKVVIRKS